MNRSPRVRVLAHYLPQFHPIAENDRFWGPGFTEWTSLSTWRPRFRGHVGFRPGELGFYDLRLPETRSAQAQMAAEHGVEAFMYWHYWFAGHRILERPFQEVLASGDPDFPFCLAWANHDWTRVWDGQPTQFLIRQDYPGDEDTKRHFAAVESAFHDPRYVRVNGEPLFFLFRPQDIPNLAATMELWKELAQASGLGGVHFVGRVDGFWDLHRARELAEVLDSVTDYSLGYLEEPPARVLRQAIRKRMGRYASPEPTIMDYKLAVSRIPRLFGEGRSYPTILTGWDSTPRHGARGVVLRGRSVTDFEAMCLRARDLVATRPEQDRIVFLKSWNEWAEGNYIEPDSHSGREFLEALERVVFGDAGRALP